MTIDIVAAPPGDKNALKFLDALSKRNGYCVGFLPLIAYEQAIDKDRVTLLFYNDQPAGYLIRGPVKETTKIYQLVIAEDLRRIVNGTALLNHLITQANAGRAHQITLHCAEDLEANLFWQSLGLQRIGKRLKDKTGKRWQIRYRLELPEKQLAFLRTHSRLDERALNPLHRILSKGGVNLGSILEAGFNRRRNRS